MESRFARILGAVIIVSAVSGIASASTIWSGYDLTFSKPAFADWTQPEFQDRITDNVWLTRASVLGLFNIAVESAYAGQPGQSSVSPINTQWALGTTADLPGLTFQRWSDLARDLGGAKNLPGNNLVLHLILDDIYLDIRFTEWAGGSGQLNGGGGPFAYERAIPEPTSLALLAPLALAAWRRR